VKINARWKREKRKKENYEHGEDYSTHMTCMTCVCILCPKRGREREPHDSFHFLFFLVKTKRNHHMPQFFPAEATTGAGRRMRRRTMGVEKRRSGDQSSHEICNGDVLSEG
jgi:hypothetical protein